MTAPEGDALAPLARREGEPVFGEPWQAQVLAVAFSLVESGLFSRAAWSSALGEELRQSERAGEPDTAETYYRAALKALERLTATGGAVTHEALVRRADDWRQSYLDTPHGQPVVLRRR
ncbi:MAG: nitrile hydratase accessory protein [Alphaproteobacteria bacterium]